MRGLGYLPEEVGIRARRDWRNEGLAVLAGSQRTGKDACPTMKG